MAQLLISFCNVFPRELALGVFDYEKETFGWIDSGQISKNIMGFNGISAHDGKYFVVTQLRTGGISGLTVLNKKDLQILDSYQLKETIDAHSLIVHDDGFLVTDTGKNRLVRLTLTNGNEKITESEFWNYNNDGKDTIHLNSIAKIGNEVFVTIFGIKPEEGWKIAKSGKIINITTDHIIFENLHHPHSLIAIDETLYWLESGTGIIHKYSKAKGHESFLKLEGYLRGMTYDKDYLYVAASGHRRKSRSTGVPNMSKSSTKDESRSWLYRIKRKNGSFERKELTYYGTEIYDLLILEKKQDMTKYENPINQRMWKYEDAYFNLEYKTFAIDQVFRTALRNYVENKEWDKVLSSVEQILHNSIDGEMEYFMAFALHSKREMIDKSLEYYNLALKHGFDEFWIRYNRGQLYALLGKTNLAIIDLEIAFELHPNDITISSMLNDLQNKL